MPTDRVLPSPVAREEQWTPSETTTPAVLTYKCDFCGSEQTGRPAGSGLLIWTRGTEVRYDQPPLCEQCAAKIVVGAMMRWSMEEEEGD